MLAVLIVSCSNDDDLPTDPEALVPVDVQFGEDTYYAENTEDNDITIEFSKPAISSGTITVKVISDAPLFFNTIPAAMNNEFTVAVAKGASSAKFKFNPLDDWFIDGHKLVTFELKSVTPGFTIGTKNDLLVDIFDDELRWKPLSYETTAGANRLKKTYEYMQDGKLEKVIQEKETSQGIVTTTYNYHYDAHNKLHRIEDSNGTTDIFTWENGKITKLDHIEGGIKTYYKNYQYNAEGNISQVGIYELMPEIDFYAYTTAEVYEYQNANLTKRIVYYAQDPFTWIITSTLTYEAYIPKNNPFQLAEILPNVVSQPQLPLSLRSEENGNNVLINYSYEYNATGHPVRRTATGEVTVFSYY